MVSFVVKVILHVASNDTKYNDVELLRLNALNSRGI